MTMLFFALFAKPYSLLGSLGIAIDNLGVGTRERLVLESWIIKPLAITLCPQTFMLDEGQAFDLCRKFSCRA